MAPNVEKNPKGMELPRTGAAYCSHCGCRIHDGKEVVADDSPTLCEICYRQMVHPNPGCNVPSRWF